MCKKIAVYTYILYFTVTVHVKFKKTCALCDMSKLRVLISQSVSPLYEEIFGTSRVFGFLNIQSDYYVSTIILWLSKH